MTDLRAVPSGDWRDDLCRCEDRPQHVHCPWGGHHIHFVGDDGNEITPEEAFPGD